MHRNKYEPMTDVKRVTLIEKMIAGELDKEHENILKRELCRKLAEEGLRGPKERVVLAAFALSDDNNRRVEYIKRVLRKQA